MTILLRALTAMVAPEGRRSKLSTFYFHRVMEAPDPMRPSEPDARTFDRVVGWISTQFRVLDPRDACERLVAGTLPSRPAVITFDDGYLDNLTLGAAILKRHRVNAAFFIATGFLGGGTMFNDRVIEAIRRTPTPGVDLADWGLGRLDLRSIEARSWAVAPILVAIKHLDPLERESRVRALEQRLVAGKPASLMMSPDDVRALQREGMVIGGHTRTHPILASLDKQRATDEIVGSRDDLRSILGAAPSLFAYPNGRFGDDFGLRDALLVKQAGYDFAFSTDAAAATIHSYRFAIPRFTPWNHTELRFRLNALRLILQGGAQNRGLASDVV